MPAVDSAVEVAEIGQGIGEIFDGGRKGCGRKALYMLQGVVVLLGKLGSGSGSCEVWALGCYVM